MTRRESLSCHRCGDSLSDEQVHALRGITGLPVEQLATYNLRLYCQRCERFRKRRSGRLGYFILIAMLVVVVVLWAV